MALVPPLRFATVDEGVYRGAYPTLANFRFLRTLRLRTIVSLLPEQPSADLAQFCLHEKIVLHYMPTEKAAQNSYLPSEKSEPTGLTVPVAAQVLKIMMLANNLPLYVHCMDGYVSTGTIVMCVRKLQLWTSAAAQIEFGRFSRVRGEQLSEPAPAKVQFIDTFPVDQSFGDFIAEHEAQHVAEGLSEWCMRVALFNRVSREGSGLTDASAGGPGADSARLRNKLCSAIRHVSGDSFPSTLEALCLERPPKSRR